MEYEETAEVYTPRGSRKSAASKAASSVKKLLTRRMTKSVSSERALGSGSSMEDSPSSKRFTLRHRRSKTRDKNLVERGAVTDRARRSFSLDDMDKIEKEETKLKPLEQEVKVKEVKVPKEKDTGFFKDITYNIEGLTKETPVVEATHEILTSSGANNATEAVEAKEAKGNATPVDAAGVKAEVTEQKEIEIETSASFDKALDAAATIDAGAEEAVIKSLTDQGKGAVEAAITQAKEGKEAVERVIEAEGSETKIRTRGVDVADLIPQKREASDKAEETTEGKQVAKPQRRRLKFFKSASFSLATLAVGLLIMILKNKN